MAGNYRTGGPRGSALHAGGAGQPPRHVEAATFTIPCDDLCTWVVVRPAPGMRCVSRLKYVNAMCRHAARHRAQAAWLTAVPDG